MESMGVVVGELLLVFLCLLSCSVSGLDSRVHCCFQTMHGSSDWAQFIKCLFVKFSFSCYEHG